MEMAVAAMAALPMEQQADTEGPRHRKWKQTAMPQASRRLQQGPMEVPLPLAATEARLPTAAALVRLFPATPKWNYFAAYACQFTSVQGRECVTDRSACWHRWQILLQGGSGN